jgi:hypothetical protein
MKKFRSANLAIIIAYSILLISCTNGEVSNNENPKSKDNALFARASNDLISQNKILWKEAQEKYGNAGFDLTEEQLTLNENNFEVNWSKAVQTGLISEFDKDLFEKLANDIVDVGLDSAISTFENGYKERNYKDLQLAAYQNIVSSLQYTNTINPAYFKRNNFDCGLAVVGFACAFVGLATLTAASGGLLTGFTVVGYCAASVALVRGCK